MFKKIPGTTDYRINLNGTVVDVFGSIVSLRRHGKDMVDIVLFGNPCKVKLKWLTALAWYECGCIDNLEQHLDKIRFYPADHRLRIRCGVIMQFTEPLWYRDGFRIIPSFPRYAIDLKGTVIDTVRNVCVDEDHETPSGYISKYIRVPDRNENRHISQHRLMALAWLPNKDFINRPIINHINGVKKDNSLENIEWCSYQENAQHALDTGLNQCSVAMKARDVITGEVEVFQSAAVLSRKLGLSRGWSPMSFLDRLPGFLHKKRYEIKRLDDSSPWYYENNTYDPNETQKRHYSISVLDKTTGVTETFASTRAFRRRYGIWNVENLDAAVKVFQDRYKDHELIYKCNAVLGPYRVVNKADSSLIVVDSIRQAAEFIGIGHNELNLDLRRGKKFIYSGKWIVLARDQEFDLNEYQEKPKPFYKIEIACIETGNVVIANSIKDASRLCKVVPRTISRLMKNGKRYKGYTFRPLE